MFEAAIEAGAEDVESDAEQHVVTCAPEDFNAVRDALESASARRPRRGWCGGRRQRRRSTRRPRRRLFKLLETLEDSDDVQNVYANFEVAEDVMARLGA